MTESESKPAATTEKLRSVSSEVAMPLINGAAWAAILAAGIGCATLALLIDLGEGSKRISNWLDLYDPVGNLSGKTTFAIVIWLILWAILHWRWKNRRIVAGKTIGAITLILIIASVAASCPLFFGLFSAS